MTTSAQPGKVCIHCGRDCATRPRVRDQVGKYHCRECVDRLKLAHRPVPDREQEADAGFIPIVEDPEPPHPREDQCPGCAKPISPAAAVCIHCGFNRETGERIATTLDVSKQLKRKSKPRACRDCGADLTGLAAPNCPNCGRVNDARADRAERDAEESRRITRRSWVHPIIMLAIGMGIMLAVYAARMGSDGVVFYLARFGVSLAIGVVVYFMCSVMWIGFDQPPLQTIIRLAGVYALADVAYTLTAMAGMSLIGMIAILLMVVPTLVYMGLLCKLMDIDLHDALFVAIITTVCKIVAAAVLFS